MNAGLLLKLAADRLRETRALAGARDLGAWGGRDRRDHAGTSPADVRGTGPQREEEGWRVSRLRAQPPEVSRPGVTWWRVMRVSCGMRIGSNVDVSVVSQPRRPTRRCCRPELDLVARRVRW